MKTTKQLYLSRDNRVIGGVAGGIAEYFEIDPTIVRLIIIVTALVAGSGVIAYLIAWIIMPEQPAAHTAAIETVNGTSAVQTRSRTLAGMILVALGGLFLVRQAFDVDIWRYFWPLSLIGTGLYIIIRRR